MCPQVAAQRQSLEAEQGAFLQHVHAVRDELTAVYAQLRDRETAAAAAAAQAEASRAAAAEAEAEAAEQRCAPVVLVVRGMRSCRSLL